MIRRIVIIHVFLGILMLFGHGFPDRSFADSNPKIVVLPFEIRGSKDLAYLRTQIPGIVQGQLEKDGGIITESASIPAPKDSEKGYSPIEARLIGEQLKVDYVVWGTLTRLGRKISLDASVLGIATSGKPEYVYAEGDDIENLLSTVNKVSSEIGIRIFKYESIVSISIAGNERIESDAVMKVIQTKPGDRYQKARLSQDLERIYNMGYFEDIRIEADRSGENDGKGVKIIFTVKERPTVKKVRVKGNKAIEEDKIMKEITITPGSILNSSKIKANIKQIESLYEEKHYHNTKVSYKTYPKENNQTDLEFVIEEGEKVLIKTITFEGNTAFTTKKLKKIMKTDEKGFFSWLTSSGELNMSDLNIDINNLNAEYQKNGYIDAKIGEPQIVYEGKWIFITIKIDEGPQYKMGAVDITGDLIEKKEDLIKTLNITKEKFCNKEVLQKDVIALTDICSDKGYAQADVRPMINRKAGNIADIVFEISKGGLVYFDRIVIGGNTVTRDKVIRRQIQVYEQELFSGTKLKRSVRNLYRMDYFEDIKINTPKGSKDDTMNLLVDVKEKPTGTFTFGMGYSSQDKLFGTLAIAKRNLFGRDQTLNLQAELGSVTDRYTLSFTEPWLFDIPLSAQFQLYDVNVSYDTYDKQSIGGAIKFGYPIFDYTRIYAGYSYEVDKLSDIASDADPDTVTLYDEFGGKYDTRSVTGTIHYDSRDRAYNAQATQGSDCAFSIEYAGGPFGGDISFTKYKLTLGHYFPLLAKFIGYMHGEGGYVRENSSGTLPPYEKFFLGGINSIRGFDYEGIHLTDSDNNIIGGERYVQFNAELLHPLFTEGFLGLVFYDAGNVYGQDEHVDFTDLRRSYGFGIRWYSPIGPIRFERGYIVNPRSGEARSGKWDFTMGGVF